MTRHNEQTATKAYPAQCNVFTAILLNIVVRELLCVVVQQACQKTCYQAAVISQCGCADALYPTSGKALNIHKETDQRICSTDDLGDGMLHTQL